MRFLRKERPTAPDSTRRPGRRSRSLSWSASATRPDTAMATHVPIHEAGDMGWYRHLVERGFGRAATVSWSWTCRSTMVRRPCRTMRRWWSKRSLIGARTSSPCANARRQRDSDRLRSCSARLRYGSKPARCAQPTSTSGPLLMGRNSSFPTSGERSSRGAGSRGLAAGGACLGGALPTPGTARRAGVVQLPQHRQSAQPLDLSQDPQSSSRH